MTDTFETLNRADVAPETIVNVDPHAVHSVFVDAIEGGIGYWSRLTSYRWALPGAPMDTPVDDAVDLDGFRAYVNVYDLDDSDEPREFVINRDTIIAGIVLAASNAEVSYLGDRTRIVARAILAGDPNWWAQHDADTADAIVQVGLFGQVVFG